MTPKPSSFTDLAMDTATKAMQADVRRLLKKHKSAFELHQVRARFMGAIASPIIDVNPMNEIKALFGGSLPRVNNIKEVNEIMQIFAMGLWNKLTQYSDTEHGFELMVSGIVKNGQQLKEFALMRRQEIEGFVESFFQGEEKIKLPPEVGDSLDTLEDLVGMFAGIVAMPKDPLETEPMITKTMEQLQQITLIAQKEMNIIITSSASARRQGGGAASPTLH